MCRNIMQTAGFFCSEGQTSWFTEPRLIDRVCERQRERVWSGEPNESKTIKVWRAISSLTHRNN